MIGFLFSARANLDDVAAYFRALKRAQRDIDRDPGVYKHYFLKELPERFRDLVDIESFGPGERLVFEPYTKEMFDDTHRWMASWKLFPDTREHSYETAVVA
jgi:NitT/TauT family transport system substrate-binding protein